METAPPLPGIPRSEVRMALLERLPTSADFDAFCVDYFPRVYALFATSMNRLERTNLLLDSVGHQRVWEQLRGPIDTTQLQAQNPYRGLLVFEIEDAAVFHGRTDLCAELRHRIVELLRDKPSQRLLPLLGATGCGKSSLLRAGLLASLLRPGSDGLPQLSRDRIALCVPGDRPLRSLSTAIKKCAKDTLRFEEIHELLQQQDGLVSIYERLAPTAGERELPFIVAIDQLEELYALGKSPAEADMLIARLLEASRSSSAIVVLLTMRTDFLHALSRHPDLNRAVSRGARLVSVLDSKQLYEAIAAPAEQAGSPLPPPLIEELLRQAAGQNHSLPLIQFALQRLFIEIASGQDGLVVLKRLGGIGGALAGWADALYASLEDDAERRRARRLFLGLIRPADADRPLTRRLRRVAELVPVRQEEAAIRRLLYHFSRAHSDQHGRLLTVSSDDEVMLAHETLLASWGRLSDWLKEEAELVLFLEHLDAAVAHWKKEQKARGLLWRDPDLSKLRELRRGVEPILNESQEEFFIASADAERLELAERAAQSDQRRRLAGLLSIAVVGLLACLIALGFWFRLERQAKNLARSRSASALVTQPGREVQALLLAMQAASEGGALGPLWEGLYQVSTVLVRSQVLEPPLATAGTQTLAVAFSPDSELLIGGRSDGKIALWSMADRKKRPQAISLHNGAVNYIGYAKSQHQQGSLIITASDDGTAQLWDPKREQSVLTLRGHQGGVLMAQLSPDGEQVLTAGKDGTARIFSSKDGKPLRVFNHDGEVCSAKYSPTGTRIVTASKDQLIRIFDAQTGVLLRAIGPAGSSALHDNDALVTQEDGHRGMVRYATYSRDGRKLYTAGEDNIAMVWDADSGPPQLSLSGHALAVILVEESPDGRQLLTASEDNTARLWDSKTGRLLLSLGGHTNQLNGAAFSTSGELIATASQDGTTRLFLPQQRPHRRIEAHKDWVRSAVFSPDSGKGSRILTASADGTAAVWDRDSGKRLFELTGHKQWVNSAVYNQDGSRIVTAGMDHTARVFDGKTGDPLATLLGHSDWIRYATFSPNGHMIATASKDHTTRIFIEHGDRGDGRDWRYWKTLHGHDGAVTSALFSKDGKEILTASEDHTALRFSVETGEKLGHLQQHEDWVRHAAYSQDGTRIVTASRDRTALIWAVVPPRIAGSTTNATVSSKPLLTLKGHTGWVRHAVYSADDRYILTAGGDMTARLWDAKSGEQLLVLTGHSGPVSTAEFARDGKFAVTAGRDGLVLVHAIAPDILWKFGCAILRGLRSHPDAPSAETGPLLRQCPQE